MTIEIFLVLALLAVAIFLFAMEWFSLDITTLGLLAALVLFGILTPEEAFSGFSNEIIIILGSIFILAGALMKTGVMDYAGSLVYRFAGGSKVKVILTLMPITAFFSTFMNNTTTTAVFMPAILGLAKKSKIAPSQLLIPLAFASILGGTCTLIGTSTNMAASGFIEGAGLEPFSLFEFFWVGLAVVAVGVLYMSFLGHRLLPEVQEVGYMEEYQIKDYLSEFVVTEDSPLAGKSIAKTPLTGLDLTILEIHRGDRTLYPHPYVQLAEGDLLVVKASKESLLEVKNISGIEIHPEVKLGDLDLASETIKIVEAIIMPQSAMAGQTLKELNFRRRFGFAVLAIYRKGHALATKLGSLRLRVGDVLLLQGEAERFSWIAGNRDLWILAEMETVRFRKRRGAYAIGIFLLALLAAGLQIIPLAIAFLIAALMAIALKCLTMQEAYRVIEWPLIILIAGMTSFGMAMNKTGAADYLADLIVYWTAPFGVYVIMAGFVILTVLLTQPMSNAAAVLVILPVALTTAGALQLNPRSFAVLITLAASLSFITPFEPACLIVYGPGKYRFRDFVISGFPLTLLTIALLLILVPLFWPLK
ncbi:MAG: SLC13 family permease [Acidobacteriota bacterium]